MYPPSLYRSISYASTLGVPIYIMENGIPAAKDDPSRRRWIEGCLQQVSEQQAHPVGMNEAVHNSILIKMP